MNSNPAEQEHRASATLVGVLYITGTVAGILSLAATSGGSFEGPDYLSDAASLGRGLPTGAMLILVMGLALAFIPVVAYPVLRATSQRLALGYLVFRGALETIGYIIVAGAWLVLFQIGRDYDPSAVDASGLRGAGAALAETADVIGSVGTIFFIVGAAMFYWILYRSRLVPRWLSVWGLIAIVPYLVADLLVIFAIIPPTEATVVVLDIPLALQEMVLAVWLIVRGFSSTPDPMPPAEATPAQAEHRARTLLPTS